ncbi:MAG: 4Fe-4S binding protein [Cellulosilyticaceae bacterium]
MMKKKRYQITDECVACGSCKTICPTHCISKGMPYTIRQTACIGCGLCVTRCWRKCIEKVAVDK